MLLTRNAMFENQNLECSDPCPVGSGQKCGRPCVRGEVHHRVLPRCHHNQGVNVKHNNRHPRPSLASPLLLGSRPGMTLIISRVSAAGPQPRLLLRLE